MKKRNLPPNQQWFQFDFSEEIMKRDHEAAHLSKSHTPQMDFMNALTHTHKLAYTHSRWSFSPLLSTFSFASGSSKVFLNGAGPRFWCRRYMSNVRTGSVLPPLNLSVPIKNNRNIGAPSGLEVVLQQEAVISKLKQNEMKLFYQDDVAKLC